MNKLEKIRTKRNFNFWRTLMDVWTFIFFTLTIIDFIYGNELEGILNTISSIYIGVLAIYVSNKDLNAGMIDMKKSILAKFSSLSGQR